MTKYSLIFLGLATVVFLGMMFYGDYRHSRRMARLKEKVYRFPLDDEKILK